MKKTKGLSAVHSLIVFLCAFAWMFAAAYITKNFAVSSLITELGYAVIVIAALYFTRSDYISVLRIDLPAPRNSLASLAIFFGAYLAQSGLMNLINLIFPSAQNNDVENYSKLLPTLSPTAAVILICVLPAVCEEMLYRGFILSSLQKRFSPAPAILMSAFLFASMHLDLYKFIPTMLLGIALGYIAYRTRTLILPIILHFLNNFISVSAIYTYTQSSDEFTAIGVGPASEAGIITAQLSLGVLIAFFGYRIFRGKPMKATLAVILTCSILTVLGAAYAVNGLFNDNDMFSGKIVTSEESVTKNESFVIEDSSIIIITCQVQSSEEDSLPVTVSIVRDDGEPLPDSSLSSSGDIVTTYTTAEAGDYELVISVPADESPGDVMSYVVSVQSLASVE